MCNKKQFDKKTAQSALNEAKIGSKHKKYRKELRIYECPECGYWHLTSQEEYAEREELSLDELKFKDKWLQLKSEKPVEI